MNNSQKTFKLGQSIWYDNIHRKLLENGELKRMISEGKIYGVTSNPSIFNKAIAKSDAYDEDLIPMLKDNLPPIKIFEALAEKDIQWACDLFGDLYEETNGGDGFVSLEVNPTLANNTDETCEEVKRLWEMVDRPNLMIKIPATKAGIPAIERSIAEGINVNVTLIFSQKRYEKVMGAFISGLERRAAAGKSIDGIASVASFFVSRMDTKVDKRLEAIISEGGSRANKANALLGKSAIANAKLAYQRYKKVFENGKFQQLKVKGARAQRPLWASTSTKNPAYPDTMYVDSLIGPNTVNTIPTNTLDAFLEHGNVERTLETQLEESGQVLEDLENLGISVETVTDELEVEGVASFSESFESLLETIEARKPKPV